LRLLTIVSHLVAFGFEKSYEVLAVNKIFRAPHGDEIYGFLLFIHA